MNKKPIVDFNDEKNPFLIGVSISNKHLHLSRADVETLFGEGYQLTVKKMLSQPGQFAAEECVKLVGPKGSIDNLRIIGPERKQTQIELAQTDARQVGIKAALRESGDVEASGACKLIGPAGEVELNEGVIIAKPHIHLSAAEAEEMGLENGELIDLYFGGDKPMILFDVIVRAGAGHQKDIHIDTDEANAAQYANGQKALVIKHE